jgi:hypothetical protein
MKILSEASTVHSENKLLGLKKVCRCLIPKFTVILKYIRKHYLFTYSFHTFFYKTCPSILFNCSHVS